MKKLSLFLIFFLTTSLSYSQLNPEALDKYYREHFEYVTDIDQFKVEDYFQKPHEFVQNRAGDCEDYAIHAYYTLKTFGYDPVIYVLEVKDTTTGGSWGHAITVYKSDTGRYNVFDTGNLKYTNKLTSIEAVQAVYPNWLIIGYLQTPIFGEVNTWKLNFYVRVIKWRR